MKYNQNVVLVWGDCDISPWIGEKVPNTISVWAFFNHRSLLKSWGPIEFRVDNIYMGESKLLYNLF